MPDLVYGPAAIEHARTTVAAEARRVPALVDGIGQVSPTAFGRLASSPTMITALGELTHALIIDFTAAGERLGQVDRALDATLTSIRSTDDASAATMTPGG